MNEDVEIPLFYDSDESGATFVFALPDASITFKMNRNQGGYHDGSLLLANFQLICKKALEELSGIND